MALADAGDGVEDANMGEDMADALIPRLHNVVEWTKEMINQKDNMRKDGETYCDRLFIR